MSSPHVAGAAILLRATHPTWTPGQVKSALMTTSLTNVVKENLTTPADPFDMGAGRIDIGKSNLAPLTFDETAANYAALTGDPIHAVDLNVPSINAPVLPGRLTTTRVVKNVTGFTRGFTVSTKSRAHSSIQVTPSSFSLAPGASRTLTITIRTNAPQGVQQFGEIRIKRNNGAQQMHLPVAWIHTPGNVSLTQSCVPASIPKGSTTTCSVAATNETFDEQTADLDTFTTSNLAITGASGATIVDAHHAQLHGVILDGVQPGVPDVADGALAGYVPLD